MKADVGLGFVDERRERAAKERQKRARDKFLVGRDPWDEIKPR